MRVFRAVEAALLIALLSACGGGGGSVSISTGQTSQTSGLSAYPISNNRVVLSPTGGYTGAVDLPGVSSGTGAMVTIAAQTSPPVGIATLASGSRRSESARHLESTSTPLLFIVFTPDRNAVLTGHPGFEITLPQPPASGVSYDVAALNSTNQWTLGLEGPAAISGSSLTFQAPSGAVSWSANQPYWYAVYASATSGGLACSTVTASNGATYKAAHVGGGNLIDVESAAYANCTIGIYISPTNGPAALTNTAVDGGFAVGVFVDGLTPMTIDHVSICTNGSNADGTCVQSATRSPGIALAVQSTPAITITHTNIDGYAAGIATSPCPNPLNNVQINDTKIADSSYPWSLAGGAINFGNATPASTGANNTCSLSGIATNPLH